MLSSSFIPLLGALFLLPLTLAAAGPGFPYGSDQKVRGINLGGWLIIQPWITPSIFNNTDPRVLDEYTFTKYIDRSVAKAVLKNHWDTWITESDFQQISAAGLNHVRIPIGYWAFEVSGGEPYIQGQLEYLHKAVRWAKKYNLKVLIDLYGAPGSQNGFINSGEVLPYPTWQSNITNVQRTIGVMETLTSMFADCTETVPTIGSLNEPAGYRGPAVIDVAQQYYKDSYQVIRNPSPGNETSLFVMIHDGFLALSFWDGFMPEPEYTSVLLDTHIYQMFTPAENQQTFAEHIQVACTNGSFIASSPLTTVVGEWTTTANDCVPYINGRFNGSIYDGSIGGGPGSGNCTGMTGSATTFSADYITFLGQYWQTQVMTYEKYGAGWIQWTWKAENADEWTYQAGLKYGWIPAQLTNSTEYVYQDEDGEPTDFCA